MLGFRLQPVCARPGLGQRLVFRRHVRPQRFQLLAAPRRGHFGRFRQRGLVLLQSRHARHDGFRIGPQPLRLLRSFRQRFFLGPHLGPQRRKFFCNLCRLGIRRFRQLALLLLQACDTLPFRSQRLLQRRRLDAGRGFRVLQSFFQLRNAPGRLLRLGPQLLRAFIGFSQRVGFRRQVRLQRFQLLAALRRGHLGRFRLRGLVLLQSRHPRRDGFRIGLQPLRLLRGLRPRLLLSLQLRAQRRRFYCGLGRLRFRRPDLFRLLLFQLGKALAFRGQALFQFQGFRRGMRPFGLRLLERLGLGFLRLLQLGQLLLKLHLPRRQQFFGLLHLDALAPQVHRFLGQPLHFGLKIRGALGDRRLFPCAALPIGAFHASPIQFRAQLFNRSPRVLPLARPELQLAFVFARPRHGTRVFIRLPANLFEFRAAGHQLPPYGRQVVHGLVAVDARLIQRALQLNEARARFRRFRPRGLGRRGPAGRRGQRAGRPDPDAGRRPPPPAAPRPRNPVCPLHSAPPRFFHASEWKSASPSE